ncbi:hypothetical protein LOK49_LG03G03794 [Camellia lanceoleosa]|uniref:Uncharacterized protein n=1 Tax=Camellia lanceoleosa TaxID=1840588 RepID=A0ACC0IHU1_9ERIC|nr:hypothetical protein LOK49_LG03G03794 [Camellia lanceoleosa]
MGMSCLGKVGWGRGQVKVDRLWSFDYEREVMGANVVVWENVESDVFEYVGGDEHFVDEMKGDGGNTEATTHAGNVEFGCSDGRVRFKGEVVYNVSPIKTDRLGASMGEEVGGTKAECVLKESQNVGVCGTIMWEDATTGVVVYFSDVKNLIHQNCIHGNVIDAYGELLKSDHLRMYGDDELADKSYFFNSDMVKNNDIRAMEKFVRRNVSAASECRFIHFPMCHTGHWTLVVYDTEDRSRKHYNPMRQHGDRADVHHNEVTVLKERTLHVMKQTLHEFELDEQSIVANFSNPLEFVTNYAHMVITCNNSLFASSLTGVIICAIMRRCVSSRCGTFGDSESSKVW